MKKLLLAMAAVAMLFASCSKDDDKDNLAEKIIGKWIFTERNGEPTPTNMKRVFTFISPTEVYISASRSEASPNDTIWFDRIKADVAISGNKVSLINHPNEHKTSIHEFYITAIDATGFSANEKVTVTVDGEVELSQETAVRFTRVTADYKQAILGKWEGHVTSEQGSEFDDGEDHQWEYLSDGTFRYYLLDDDSNWVTNPNQTLSEYFVDGTLLCTRWVIDGTVNREWWEIESIANGVMNWTALRQREDGTTYTATFSMTKVN